MNLSPHLELVYREAAYLSRRLTPHQEPRAYWGDGFRGLLYALANYNPERGKFDNYAKWCIRGWILAAYRNWMKIRHGPRTLPLSLELMQEKPVMRSCPVEEKDLLESLLQGLDEVNQNIFRLRLEGHNVKEIARITGKGCECVKQRIWRSMVRLRKEAEKLCA